MLRSLMLGLEVFGAFQPNGVAFDIEGHQRRAMRVGSLAMHMFEAKADREDALTAGMLHDVGSLLLATFLPSEWQQTRALADELAVESWVAERQVLGVTHAELGAYLLGLWGLPYPIVEATAYHHLPEPPGDAESWGPAQAVWLANLILTDPERELPARLSGCQSVVDNYGRWVALARSEENAA
jgi:hypothetical protein